MIDLFAPPKSKKDLLLDYIREKHYFSSVHIAEWGLKNYYLRAMRTVRDFCERDKPIVRRLDKQEKVFRGFLKDGNQNIGWYEYIDKPQ